METAAWLQAFATLILVGVTYWYARLTRSISSNSGESAASAVRAAEAAEQSAEIAQAAVEVSERTMLLAHMPQLIGRLHGASQRGLKIRVANAGPTPAYNIEVVLFFGLTHQPRSEPWRVSFPLGPNDEIEERISLPIPFADWDADKTLESQIRYNDAVGNRFLARLWHYREWDETTPQSTIYLVNTDGSLENLTTNVALTP